MVRHFQHNKVDKTYLVSWSACKEKLVAGYDELATFNSSAVTNAGRPPEVQSPEKNGEIENENTTAWAFTNAVNENDELGDDELKKFRLRS